MDMDNTTSFLDLSVITAGDIIGDATFYYLTVVLRVILNPICSMLAFCAGLVNILTFARMDLGQGVNLNLLILSVSDFSLAIIISIGNAAFFFIWLDPKSLVFRKVVFFTLLLVNYPIIASTVVTTIIAVVRCLSVVIPLRFHDFVNAGRQVVAIGLGCCVGCSNLVYNQLVMVGAVGDGKVDGGITDVFRNVFFFACLSINVVAMVFLAFALKQSSRFQSRASKLSSEAASQHKLFNRKEARVIKTVILVLVIFVACNIQLMLLSVFRLFFAEISYTGQYLKLRQVIDMVISLSYGLNVALNTLVYFNYNSQFQAIVKRLLPCSSAKGFKKPLPHNG